MMVGPSEPTAPTAVRPTLGRIVHYRSRTGKYTVPAMIVGTVDTLNEEGVDLYLNTGGAKGVPPLEGISGNNVHLVVFTPGIPGMRGSASDFSGPRADARISENVNGCYQEWDVPLDGSEEAPVENVGEQTPGTWTWPPRVP